MIQYFDEKDLACIDGYSFRRDKKTGYYLSSKPIGKKRKRLHVYIWEKFNGPVPKNMHIHHKDKNKYNNELENLVCISSDEHKKIHAHDVDKNKLKENLLKNALPKAAEWHKSDVGRAWHSEHAKKIFMDRKPQKYICDFCGKEFETLNIYSKNSNKFCSNNCKSAYRRKTGVDNIEKKCEKCGNKFIVNKYSKRKYCESCKNKKHKTVGDC